MPLPDLSPLVGCVVGRLDFDYRVSLNLLSQDGEYGGRVEALLVVGGCFEVRRLRRATRVEPDKQINYAAVLALLHATVSAVEIAGDEALTLSFREGSSLHVPRDAHYEAWELSGRGVPGWIAGPL